MAITSNVPPTQRGMLEIGSDVALNFTMTTTIDVTSWTFLFEFFDTSGDLIFSKTNGSGLIITSPTTGVVQVQVNSLDTILLDPANYNSWLHRIDSNFMTPLAKVVFYLRQSTYE